MSAPSVSAAEFDLLQEQLIALKTEKYELKERERKLVEELKARDEQLKGANVRMQQLEQAARGAEAARVTAVKQLEKAKDKKFLEGLQQQNEGLQRQMANLREETQAQSDALRSNLKMLMEQNTLLQQQLKAAASHSGVVGPDPSGTAGAGDAGVDSAGDGATGPDALSLTAQLFDLKNVLEKKEGDLKVAADKNAALSAVLAEKEKEVAAMQEQIAGRDKEIARLNGVLRSSPAAPVPPMQRAGSLFTNLLGKHGPQPPPGPPPPAPSSSLAPPPSSSGSPSSPREPPADSVRVPPQSPLPNGPYPSGPSTPARPASTSNDVGPPAESEQPAVGGDDPSAKLIDALQKKDRHIESLQNDMDRFLQKLGEKEQIIMQLRDQLLSSEEVNKQNKELRDQLKERDERLKKVSISSSDIAKNQQLQEQLKLANETCLNLGGRLEAVNRELHAAEDNLQQARKAVEDKETEVLAVQEQFTLQSYSITELKVQIEALRESQQVQLQQWEHKLAAAEEEARTAVEQAKRDVEAANAQLESAESRSRARVAELERLLTETKIALSSLEHKVGSADGEKAAIQSELDAAKAEVAKLKDALGETDAEKKIEAKKRNHMLQELKEQLRKAAVRNAELEANLQAANEFIKELKSSQDRRQPSISLSPGPPTGPPTVMSSTSSPRISMSSPLPPGTTPQDARAGRRLSTDSIPSVASPVEAEVSAALAKRLAEVQDANFQLKQKVSFLEEAVRLANEDVDQKKQIIRNYVRRIETGALTTLESAAEIQRRASSATNRGFSNPEELLAKTELVLNETTLENIQLRVDKEKLGSEFQKVLKQQAATQQQADALKAELEALSSQHQGLLDEAELHQATISDTRRLLREAEDNCTTVTARLAEAQRRIEQLEDTIKDYEQSFSQAGRPPSVAAPSPAPRVPSLPAVAPAAPDQPSARSNETDSSDEDETPQPTPPSAPAPAPSTRSTAHLLSDLTDPDPEPEPEPEQEAAQQAPLHAAESSHPSEAGSHPAPEPALSPAPAADPLPDSPQGPAASAAPPAAEAAHSTPEDEKGTEIPPPESAEAQGPPAVQSEGPASSTAAQDGDAEEEPDPEPAETASGPAPGSGKGAKKKQKRRGRK